MREYASRGYGRRLHQPQPVAVGSVWIGRVRQPRRLVASTQWGPGDAVSSKPAEIALEMPRADPASVPAPLGKVLSGCGVVALRLTAAAVPGRS